MTLPVMSQLSREVVGEAEIMPILDIEDIQANDPRLLNPPNLIRRNGSLE